MDIITLKSLTFHAKHGFYESERNKGNHFELDIIAEGDFKPAIKSDNLDLTFNYEWVDQVATEVFNGKPEKLIETLCFKIGEKIFNKSENITKLTVSVRKMNPPIQSPAKYAEITMKWKR